MLISAEYLGKLPESPHKNSESSKDRKKNSSGNVFTEKQVKNIPCKFRTPIGRVKLLFAKRMG